MIIKSKKVSLQEGHLEGKSGQFTILNFTLLSLQKKNIEGQVLTYNSKNFHWLNRKLDLERTMNGLGKPSRKKSNRKNKKHSRQIAGIAAKE